MENQDGVRAVLICIASGLFGFIAVAIAGIAIVINLFSKEEIKLIEELNKGAYKILLDDFGWFALLSSIELLVALVTYLIIGFIGGAFPKGLFIGVASLYVYVFVYILFYAYALVKNCIALDQLRRTMEAIGTIEKNAMEVRVNTIELQMDYLVACTNGMQKGKTREYYAKLMELARISPYENKDEIESYIKSRYL